ncbi:MAG: 2-oxo acid dehydrogenase subunit E2 [Flavobacteriaceae bacterium]|nr:2-oxo acid dehydrogenase subunit E2 [Flavobacteriaceae bacterium]
MAKFELKLPKMGESVAEATITSWLKELGDTIEIDEAILEIATDKVDTELPSEVEGVLVEKLFNVDDVVQVGQTIAIIEISSENEEEVNIEEDGVIRPSDVAINDEDKMPDEMTIIEKSTQIIEEMVVEMVDDLSSQTSDKFYSPLVKNIAKQEGVSFTELETISGTGKDNRVTKTDILNYIETKKNTAHTPAPSVNITKSPLNTPASTASPVSVNGKDEIIEMTRMGKLIAKHMVNSLQTAAHVQSFIEVDVTKIVTWRNKVKESFFNREGEKITFTPIFMQAVAKAIKDYPMINISVDGDTVIKYKNINLGMATALNDGNLIVPVIKNADQLNLVGMTKAVNSLAQKARTNKLSADDIQGGTYTVTNVGGFGSVFGTPIINQPQVAILALGAIRKVPAVIETAEGDFIGIRHKMFLSHSYDHRVVNGALGGMFIKRVAEILESFDVNQSF